LSSPVENSNNSINIPNNVNEIDSDEVMVGEVTNISNNNQEGNIYDNNNSNHHIKSLSHNNNSNALKQKEVLGDEKILGIDNNERNGQKKLIYNNNFRSYIEEDTDEDESIIEEEEDDDEMVGDEKVTRNRYSSSSVSKYNKKFEKIISSSYPSTHLNPIITDTSGNQNSKLINSSNYYNKQCSCADCENCSDQEMYDEYNQKSYSE